MILLKILEILTSNWSRWFKSSTESTISTSWIQNKASKNGTRTHLGFESHLPKHERWWKGEFTKLKLRYLHSAVLYYPHGNIASHHSCSENQKSNEPRVRQRLSSILWLLVPVCFRTTECLVLSIRAKYRHVMTIWRHSPTVYNFSPFEVMVVKTWCGDLKKLALHNIHNRGSRSTKTAPVSEQWLLSTSSPPSMVSSFVFWPSGCVPCSRRYNSRHALLQMWASCPRRKFKSTSSPSPMVLSLGLWPSGWTPHPKLDVDAWLCAKCSIGTERRPCSSALMSTGIGVSCALKLLRALPCSYFTRCLAWWCIRESPVSRIVASSAFRVLGWIAHSFAEERARFLGRRPGKKNTRDQMHGVSSVSWAFLSAPWVCLDVATSARLKHTSDENLLVQFRTTWRLWEHESRLKNTPSRLLMETRKVVALHLSLPRTNAHSPSPSWNVFGCFPHWLQKNILETGKLVNSAQVHAWNTLKTARSGNQHNCRKGTLPKRLHTLLDYFSSFTCRACFPCTPCTCHPGALGWRHWSLCIHQRIKFDTPCPECMRHGTLWSRTLLRDHPTSECWEKLETERLLTALKGSTVSFKVCDTGTCSTVRCCSCS